MATTVAIAQRKEAAIKRILDAAAKLGVDAPDLGNARDPQMQLAQSLEATAGVLEAAIEKIAAAPSAPTKRAKPAPEVTEPAEPEEAPE